MFVTLNGAQTPGSMVVTRTEDSTLQFATLPPMSANVTFTFARVLDLSIVQTLNVDGSIQLKEPWEFTASPQVPEASTTFTSLGRVGAPVV